MPAYSTYLVEVKFIMDELVCKRSKTAQNVCMSCKPDMDTCSQPDLHTVMLRTLCEQKCDTHTSCFMGCAQSSQARVVSAQGLCTWSICHMPYLPPALGIRVQGMLAPEIGP